MKILFQYLFLLFHAKLNLNFFIKIIKKNLFKFKLPTFILRCNDIYFDEGWYVNEYNIPKDINPIIHYLEIGFKKGYNPSPNFDTNFYINEYLDANDGINPFVHYLRHGIYEGKLPKLFTLTEIKQQKLKKTIKGQSGYLFLINDGNNELFQHYDEKYECKFDKNSFLDYYYYKKSLFYNQGIGYGYYIVPDKSVICRKLLPFKINEVRSNLDEIDEINYFTDDLTFKDYFKCDSHINYNGGKKLAFNILNHLDDSFTIEIFNDLIKNFSNRGKEFRSYDLLLYQNWSYSLPEKLGYVKRDIESYYYPSNLQCCNKNIPKQFRFYKNRSSNYFKNDESFSNLRVLIFHDSTMIFLRWYLSFYFKEMLLFWDHGNLDKDLIKWFKPDLILEIRVERFIESLPHPNWVINKEEFNK